MMERFFAFVQFIHTGGPVNYVIAGLYVLVLAVFSERFIYFFRTRYKRDRIFSVLRSEALSPDSMRPLFPGMKGQPLRIALCFLTHKHEAEPVLSEILDREAARIREEMEKRLGVLSFTGTVAPLLGLLGTITGLMNAFSQIEQRGSSVDIAFLSGGIWEAMITTATGLVTALCAVSCCKWFEHVSASRLEDMSYAVSILTERARRDEGRTENAGAYGGESGAELQKVQVREKGKESA